MVRIEDIHKTFALAIGKDGARISDEQLRLCFEYLFNTSADLLAIVNGPDGTRKSSSLGLVISFLCLDRPDLMGKFFLVLSKMHVTTNNTVRTLRAIVKPFTNLEVLREFSDAFDMILVLCFVNGQPDDLDPECTKRLEAKELQELRDLVSAISETNETTSRKAPESAIYLIAIYDAMNETGMVIKNGGKPLYEFGGKVPSSTKRSSEDDAEEDSSKTRKGQAAKGTPLPETSEKPQTWQTSLKQLQLLAIAKPQHGVSKTEDKKMVALLCHVKAFWMKEKACVVCTTVSRDDSKEIKGLGVSYVALEESQFVDPHDTAIVIANFAKVLKIFIRDVMQPSPFVKDGPFNSFSSIRRKSTFEVEVTCGHHHFELTESGRTGPAGVGLLSDLIYGGRLRSAVSDDPMMWDITRWYNLRLGAKSWKAKPDPVFPHLLLNIPYGKEE